MTPDEIAKLRVLAGAATPGLWGLLDDARGTTVCAAHGSITICCFAATSRTALADARYIAAACNAVPRLCDEIERLRAEFRAHGEVCVEGADANAATIAELRADVERLTRELREAREAIRCYCAKCHAGCGSFAERRCGLCAACCASEDSHCPELPHAPAIRAAEGSE